MYGAWRGMMSPTHVPRGLSALHGLALTILCYPSTVINGQPEGYKVTNVKSSSTTQAACNHRNLSFTCQPGTRFNVIQAYYGTSASCSYAADDCLYPHLAIPACTGRRQCSIEVGGGVDIPYCRRSSYLQVDYECIPASSITDVCKNTALTKSSGYLATPGYPMNYKLHIRPCVTSIHALPGYEINIYVLDLDLAYSITTTGRRTCRDQLFVYEEVSSRKGRTLCSRSNIERGQLIYTATSSPLHVEFQAGYSDATHKGFWLFYESFKMVSKSAVPLPSAGTIMANTSVNSTGGATGVREEYAVIIGASTAAVSLILVVIVVSLVIIELKRKKRKSRLTSDDDYDDVEVPATAVSSQGGATNQVYENVAVNNSPESNSGVSDNDQRNGSTSYVKLKEQKIVNLPQDSSRRLSRDSQYYNMSKDSPDIYQNGSVDNIPRQCESSSHKTGTKSAVRSACAVDTYDEVDLGNGSSTDTSDPPMYDDPWNEKLTGHFEIMHVTPKADAPKIQYAVVAPSTKNAPKHTCINNSPSHSQKPEIKPTPKPKPKPTIAKKPNEASRFTKQILSNSENALQQTERPKKKVPPLKPKPKLADKPTTLNLGVRETPIKQKEFPKSSVMVDNDLYTTN